MRERTLAMARSFHCNAVWVKLKDTVEWMLTSEQVNEPGILLVITGGDEPFGCVVSRIDRGSIHYKFDKNRCYTVKLMAGDALIACCTVPEVKATVTLQA